MYIYNIITSFLYDKKDRNTSCVFLSFFFALVTRSKSKIKVETNLRSLLRAYKLPFDPHLKNNPTGFRLFLLEKKKEQKKCPSRFSPPRVFFFVLFSPLSKNHTAKQTHTEKDTYAHKKTGTQIFANASTRKHSLLTTLVRYFAILIIYYKRISHSHARKLKKKNKKQK